MNYETVSISLPKYYVRGCCIAIDVDVREVLQWMWLIVLGIAESKYKFWKIVIYKILSF